MHFAVSKQDSHILGLVIPERKTSRRPKHRLICYHEQLLHTVWMGQLDADPCISLWGGGRGIQEERKRGPVLPGIPGQMERPLRYMGSGRPTQGDVFHMQGWRRGPDESRGEVGPKGEAVGGGPREVADGPAHLGFWSILYTQLQNIFLTTLP